MKLFVKYWDSLVRLIDRHSVKNLVAAKENDIIFRSVSELRYILQEGDFDELVGVRLGLEDVNKEYDIAVTTTLPNTY